MRGSRTLLVAVAALVSVGFLLDLAASAAGFTLSSGTSGTSTTSTTSGTTSTSSDQVTTALFALAAGPKTIAGPGSFLERIGEDARIYDVLGGPAVNACITLRNLSNGEVRVSSSSISSFDVGAGETRTVCLGAPVGIVVSCRSGSVCEGVWRIDRL